MGVKRAPGVLRRFLRDTRAAAGVAAALLTVGTVAGGALIVDHVWLYDQRDVLKTAAEAASIAATLDIERQLKANPHISDADLEAALRPVAERYVLVNLAHLAPERLRKAKDTLEITQLALDRGNRTVTVTVKADLGGTLFSRHLPLLASYEGPEDITVKAGVESESTPVEVVLAIDVSGSMIYALDSDSAAAAISNRRMTIVRRAAKDLVDILAPDGYNRVAVGVVPWYSFVRLDADRAERWAREGWALYPQRRTYPWPYTARHLPDHVPTPVVDKVRDAPPLVPWGGCFDGHRIRAGVASLPDPTAAALFEDPATTPFAQSYFPPIYNYTYLQVDPATLPFHPLLANGLNQFWEDDLHRYHNDDDQILCRPADHAPLFPLSTDRAAIDGFVDDIDLIHEIPVSEGGEFQPVFTYSTLGVLWAQRMLEPAWKRFWGTAGIHPADPATPEHADLRKAIVLLTDGEDTWCRGNRNHDCSDSPLAVSRTDACTAAKSRGTEIFIVAAMHPDKVSDKFGDGLRDCSSENDRDYPQGTRRPGTTYVFLENATPADLEAAFADIAKQLRKLRRIR